MEFRVRLAAPADASLLPDVERSADAASRSVPDLAWVEGDGVISAERHRGLIHKGDVWIVEDAAAVLAGFLSAERFGGELHVWGLAVRRERQGSGLGRRLLEAAIARARDAGVDSITLTTFCNVPWNEPFYARLGFETLGEGALGPRLTETLEREVAHGLPRERRCGMRMRINTL